MTTIRRIYAYLLALAGLLMLSLAAANLIQLLIDVVLQSAAIASEGSLRNTVSLSAAAALVGLPVWLVHWLWVGHWVRAEPQERASPLRRLYLYSVLVGATLEMVGSATQTLSSAFTSLVGTAASGDPVDAIARPLPFFLVASCVWLAHWRISEHDRALVGERGGSATLRRWYLYGAAFVGLVLLLRGTQAVLESLWLLLAQPGGSAWAGLTAPAAQAVVGLGVWFAHWVVLPTRVSETDTHDDDSASVLRSVYLFGALAVGVIGCLLGASQLLYYAVARGLGVAHPGGVGGDLLQAAAGPASIAIVYAAAWAYQRQALRRQSATFTDAPRQAGVRRLYAYLVALVALGVLASGVAGLLWTLGDLFFPVSAVAASDGAWREQVSLYATLTLVGLPVWLLHWRRRATAVAETRSLARRLYVFLSLIVAMLALVGSAAAALYRLLGLALGATFSIGTAADLAHALAVASVAFILAAYHWQVLRADARRTEPETGASAHATTAPAATLEAHVPEGPRAPGAPGISGLPGSPSVSSSLVVEIHAADGAALAAAVSVLRATGVQVTVLASDARAGRP